MTRLTQLINAKRYARLIRAVKRKVVLIRVSRARAEDRRRARMEERP